jgi:hypothetical protein
MVLNNPCQDYPGWMPRVFYPAFRGIIIRGIERRKIFRDNKDCDILVEAVRELGISGTHLATLSKQPKSSRMSSMGKRGPNHHDQRYDHRYIPPL